MLNAHLEIPFMEAKGTYHVIAEILGFEHLGKGIFQDQEGNKFYLDKYGFHDFEVYNFKERCKELEKLLDKSKNGGQITQLKKDVDRLEKKVENQKAQISQLDKINSKNKQEARSRLEKARQTVADFTSFELGEHIIDILEGDRTNTKKVRMLKELFKI
jgi:predicted  nucleic acid-binding Zn-ribbon protein